MKRVMIVEDDLSILEAMTVILRGAGHVVTTLLDGQLLLHNDFQTPDIFIIDKQLQRVNGLDVCRHLKSNAETRNIPVIMVSVDPDIHIYAKSAGADDALEKPFKMKELRDVVTKHLGN